MIATRTVGERLRRGFSFSLFGQLSTQALAFLIAPLLARVLTPAEFGVISIANSVRNVLVLLMPMSAALTVSYFYNLHRSAPALVRRTVGAIACLAIASSTAWLLVSLCAGPFLQRHFLTGFRLAFWPHGALVIVSAWLLAFQSVPTALLGASERHSVIAWTNVALALPQAAFTVIAVLVLRRSAAGHVEAQFFSALLALPFFLFILRKEAPPVVDRPLWKEAIGITLPLLPHQLALWVLNFSDRLIVGHYGFAHDLGLYSFGCTVAMILAMVIGAFNSIWSPVFLEQARANPDAQIHCGDYATWSFVALAAVTGGLILFAPELIAILGGARWAGSVPYVAPVLIGYFLQATYGVPMLALYHLKRTRRIPLISVTSGAVNILVNIALIPRYGVMVAAWSTAFCYGMMSALAFALGHPLFPLRYQWKPLLVIPLFLAVAFAMQRAHEVGWLYSPVKAIVWLAAAAGALLWWKHDHPAPSPGSIAR